ncbi:MAG: hypothetical protein H6739_29080 [Alphaproteobacteria bacterium]|nr:hypothetical protein [Alphaproteobacteria bacterium]
MPTDTVAKVGRALMTLTTLTYGLIPPLADISPTHLFHPDWPPHARMHATWLMAVNTSLSVLSLTLLWRAKDPALGTKAAGLLGTLVYAGFFLSAGTAPLYGGALSDEGGVPSLGAGLDANLVVFSITSVLHLTGWALASRGSST